ncbi:MAG: response regulator [Deltaproteobacteria bacterium]|nr:response regulator [Deltaproteobacteria bacterium]
MATMIANRSEPSLDGRFPASPAGLHPSPEDQPAPPAGGLRLDSGASRILIVDDDPAVLELVSKMAARLGYHPTVAEDGVDALYYLTRNRYDLVLTDYEMPFIDGYQLADQIKERHFGTRVIVMTGSCDPDVLDMLDGCGIVDGVLLKPFNLNTLKEKIERVSPSYPGKWGA